VACLSALKNLAGCQRKAYIQSCGLPEGSVGSLLANKEKHIFNLEAYLSALKKLACCQRKSYVQSCGLTRRSEEVGRKAMKVQVENCGTQGKGCIQTCG